MNFNQKQNNQTEANKGKEKFIQDLIDFLNKENEKRIFSGYEPLDVCFITSPIVQQIEKCTDFMFDILQYEYKISQYEEDYSNYTNGYVLIEMQDKYCNCDYKIIFKDTYKTCGDCDWYIPSFKIIQVINHEEYIWDNGKEDYWEYEKQFKLKQAKQNEKIEKYKKEQERQKIEAQIKELQEKLKAI